MDGSEVASPAPGGGAEPVSWRERPIALALAVAIVLLIPTGTRPGGETLVAVAAIAAVLVVATRWHVPTAAIAVLLVVGAALRLMIETHTGSDVLDVVAAAIQRVQLGGNPYGVGYAASRPEGAPYAYGPLALLAYAPLGSDGWQLELAASCVVLVALALQGRLLGLVIYAVSPVLVVLSADGSNDTTVGLLLLATFVVARRRPVVGAVLLGATVALKPYAAAWAPAFLVWAGWPAIVALGITTALLWSPVLLVWGIPSFLTSLDMANKVHALPYWSFGELLKELAGRSPSRELLDNLRLVLGAITAVVTLRWARSLDAVILAGTLVYLVTLYMGFWSTYAYFAAIGPILCWRIDDWLGLPTRPLVEVSQRPATDSVSPA